MFQTRVAHQESNVAVLRVKEDFTFDLEKLIRAADSIMGKSYAKLDALFSVFDKIPPRERGRFSVRKPPRSVTKPLT